MSAIRSALLSIFLVFLFLPIPDIALADDASVEFFSPQGTVKVVRQVGARFSEPIVPFGDPRISDPFDISCAQKGKGRWADGKNWVYDFDDDLPAGVTCEFSTKSGLKTLAGNNVKTRSFSFSTGGPSVRAGRPREGDESIDEEQVFILVLDAEPTGDSLLQNAYFTVSGVNEKIGIRILTGDERKNALDAVNLRSLAASVSGRIVMLRTEKPKPGDLPPVVVIQAKQRFPSLSDVRLVWGKGVTSVTGVSNEEDQTLSFRTRKPFTANFSCRREQKDAACIPILPVRLSFSAPVPWETAQKIRLKGKGGKTYRAKPDSSKGNEDGDSNEDEGEGEGRAGQADETSKQKPEFVRSVFFRTPLPEKSSFLLELPKPFPDDAGRRLSNANKFPITVRTADAPPLAKFAARFGVIELKGDAVLPVTLRNIEADVPARSVRVVEKAAPPHTPTDDIKGKSGEKVDGLQGRMRKLGVNREGNIIAWLRSVAAVGRTRSLLKGSKEVKNFGVPKPGGARAFEVVGIPLKEPGLYIVEMESRILGSSLLYDGSKTFQKKPVYVPTSALVTNMSVHFKKGRESSLVWVTNLDRAMPVQNAAVSVTNCEGKVLWKGKTDSRGIAMIGTTLPEPGDIARCNFRTDEDNHDWSQLKALQGMNSGLFVFARKDNDMSFVHSSWDEGIESWRFNLPSASYTGPVTAHTVFDRTLLRAGETVSMKHFIRKKAMRGFEMPPSGTLPNQVVIEHLGSSKKFESGLKFDASGIAETSWKIPVDANLGEYQVTLLRKEKENDKKQDTKQKKRRWRKTYNSGTSWASGRFRVEEFRIPLMKGIIQPRGEPIVGATEIEADLMVTYLSGGGAGNADVKLRSSLQPKSVQFADYDDFSFANGAVREGLVRSGSYAEANEEGEDRKPKVEIKTLKLDRTGALRTKLGPFGKTGLPQEALTELEFRDPNGEVQTVSKRIPLWNSRVIVGIKPDSWAASKESFKFHLVALDLKGLPVSGVTINADLFSKKNYTHRKRLIGGFYSYEHTAETKRIGKACEGITDNRGLIICDVKSPVSGNVIIQAVAKDGEGNPAVANRDVWVYGKEDWWFDVSDNDRIDLLPEKKRYEPGETAVFQVRVPFREATALVTIEREGIIDAFIKKLSGKNPVIEIPVTGSYAPNVFVSALCVRGRVAGVKPTALIDLGKPAYKLGIAEIRVGWKKHELKVEVSAPKDVYRIRDKVPVRIKARTADGSVPPAGAEIALAAVDEGLLELMPNNSWNLLEAMMSRRGHEVETATAQIQVVGKRHYGLKALTHGGGGGKQPTRELFDSLMIWKGRVKLDAKGEASAVVPLNDSLTAVRIVAIANAGAGFFGTGHTMVRTAQDLMLLSGLPPVVREGDAFSAGVTVRNASGRAMELTLSASATNIGNLEPITLSIQPGEAKEIAWNVTVPHGIGSISWEIAAKEKSGEASDGLKVKQKVGTAVPVSTYQATIAQVKESLVIEAERPKGALSGRGGISVTMRPKLAEGLAGVAEYMKHYPYTCLEQKVSIAVALRNAAMWKKIVSGMPSYLDSDGLLKYFPMMDHGSDSLTAYVLSVSAEAGWKLPDGIKAKLIDGLTGFVDGKIIRHSTMPTADLSIRKMAALEALARHTKIRSELLGSISLEPNLWPTSAVIDWMNVLLRSPHLNNRDSNLAAAEQVLRSRLNFQGPTMTFSTETADYLWWLMVSSDTNAVRSVLTLLNMDKWNDDMPRLVTGAVGRQHRGKWSTTTANAWGVLALERFSAKYESAAVKGKTTVALSKHEKSVNWAATPKGGTVKLAWPKGKETLTISHRGPGRPWAVVRSLAAIPVKEPFSSGYKIRKTLTPVSQKERGKWTRGDVVRIRLELEAQSDMTWVVVSDPIPAGSGILGTGLGRDSELLTGDEKRTGWVMPAFEERSFEAFRAYYEYVPKGKWTVEYTLRLNNDGSFKLPETRVEAMYAPEMFGIIPNKKFSIER
jgi:alpha-2-macroglobulin